MQLNPVFTWSICASIPKTKSIFTCVWREYAYVKHLCKRKARKLGLGEYILTTVSTFLMLTPAIFTKH